MTHIVSASPLAQTHSFSSHVNLSPRDEALLIMCLSAKGLRVFSKSEFCADFKK